MSRIVARFIALLASVSVVSSVFVSPVHAETLPGGADAVVGSFGVGGDVRGGIDEATGVFTAGLPILELPGLGASVDLSMSYRQELALSGGVGIARGWEWALPRVSPSGNGVTVFPASGGSYTADSSADSGLARYPMRDLWFGAAIDSVPARHDVPHKTSAYALEYQGGKDFFDVAGNLIARFTVWGHRTDYLWDDEGRLVGVVDSAGNHAVIAYTGESITVTLPVRSDGVASSTTIVVEEGLLKHVIDPTDKRVSFDYEKRGAGVLLSTIGAFGDVGTRISYQTTTDGWVVVDDVAVHDTRDGSEIARRSWTSVGEHTARGYPTYRDRDALWSSGDDAYRYVTALSDGASQVVSTFNSMGLLVERNLTVSVHGSDIPLQTHTFTYEGTADGGVPDPQNVPAHYAHPLSTMVTHRDAEGRTRTLVEDAVVNDAGQTTRSTSHDGVVTEYEYDSTSPDVGDRVPGGIRVPIGLVLQKTTASRDGLMTRVTNTLDRTYRSLSKTTTTTGKENDVETVRVVELDTDGDGFVLEQRTTGSVDTNEDMPARVSDSELVGSESTPVTTRFHRVVDPINKMVTVTQTNAVGTPVEQTTSAISDLVTGLPLTSVDPVGFTVSSSYDAAGRLVRERDDSTDGETRTVYGDRVTRVTNPRGITVSEHVDAAGRVVKITDNLTFDHGTLIPSADRERTVETRDYHDNGSRVIVRDMLGRTSVTVTDVFGRVLKNEGPTGIVEENVYDDVENTTTLRRLRSRGLGESEEKQRTVTAHDDRGRNIRSLTTRADGISVPEIVTEFDGLGRIASHASSDVMTEIAVAPSGAPKITTMTPESPRVFPGDFVTAERTFDSFGTSTKKTLSNTKGERVPGRSRVRDALGRTVSETDQLGGVTEYEYTPDGLPSVTRSVATQTTTRYDYAPRTRQLIRSETTRGTESLSRGFEYDANGNMSRVFDESDPDGSAISYTYDLLGNVTSIRYPNGKMISHAYDEWGQKTSTTDVAGNVTHYRYNDFGALTSVTQTTTSGNVVGAVVYSFDAWGRTSRIERGNGVISEFTFTAADEVATERATNSNGEILFEGTYRYDTHGNLSVATTTQGSPDEPPITKTVTHAYSAYNKLTGTREWSGPSGAGEPLKTIDYEIGITGNVTHLRETNNGRVEMREFEYNALGQTTGIIRGDVRSEQTYDAGGNLTTASDGTRYAYNLHNQPIAQTTPDGTVYRTEYWADGTRRSLTRVADSISGSLGTREQTEFYWDHGSLINDLHMEGDAAASDGDESITASYLLAATRVSRNITKTDPRLKDDTECSYYVADRHGNTVLMATSEGVIDTAYEYTDYGSTLTRGGKTGGARNPFQYASEFMNPDGVSQELGDRTYLPSGMAFTTRDTADQFNVYSYVGSNPITLVDPSGRNEVAEKSITGIFLAASVLASVAAAGALVVAARAGKALMASTGFFATSTLADATDASLALALTVEQYTPKNLIDDDIETQLMWSGVALGVLSLLATPLGMRAAAKSVTSGLTQEPASLRPVRESLPMNPSRVREPSGRTLPRPAPRSTTADRRYEIPSRVPSGEEIRDGSIVGFHGTRVVDAVTIRSEGFKPAAARYGLTFGPGHYFSLSRSIADGWATKDGRAGEVVTVIVQGKFLQFDEPRFSFGGSDATRGISILDTEEKQTRLARHMANWRDHIPEGVYAQGDLVGLNTFLREEGFSGMIAYPQREIIVFDPSAIVTIY